MKAIIFIFIIIISCRRSEIDSSVTDNNHIENIILNPKIIISRAKYNSIIATSDKLIKHDNENAILIGNVKVDFFNENGEHISKLFSDSAKIDENNNNFIAIGNVNIISDSNFTLSTQLLLWDNQYKLVTSNDSVRFTTDEGDTMYGIGFQSDMDLANYKVYKPHGITREKITE